MSRISGVVGGGTLKEQLKVVNALTSATISASAGYVAVDRLGFNSALFVITSGAVAGAGSIVPKVQHSTTTTDGDFVDVVAGDVSWGDIAGSAIVVNTLRQVSVDCRGLNRYIRIYGTLTGTSVVMGGVAVLGAAESLPTA